MECDYCDHIEMATGRRHCPLHLEVVSPRPAEEWQRGDRVFVVAQPQLTGTVNASDGRVFVEMDGSHAIRSFQPGEIEWYTRPEARHA